MLNLLTRLRKRGRESTPSLARRVNYMREPDVKSVNPTRKRGRITPSLARRVNYMFVGLTI